MTLETSTLLSVILFKILLYYVQRPGCLLFSIHACKCCALTLGNSCALFQNKAVPWPPPSGCLIRTSPQWPGEPSCPPHVPLVAVVAAAPGAAPPLTGCGSASCLLLPAISDKAVATGIRPPSGAETSPSGDLASPAPLWLWRSMHQAVGVLPECSGGRSVLSHRLLHFPATFLSGSVPQHAAHLLPKGHTSWGLLPLLETPTAHVHLCWRGSLFHTAHSFSRWPY